MKLTRNTVLPAAAALALAGLLLLGHTPATRGQAAPAAASPPPSHLAVVNIVQLFNDLNEKIAADSDIDKMRRDFEAQSDTKRKEVADLQDKVDHPQFKTDSAEYKAQQNDLVLKTRQYQAFGQYAQDMLFLELRLRTASIYSKMNKAVADYAQANGIALVFVADDLSVDAAKSQEQLQAMVTLRKLIYFHPSFDITTAIRNKMNTDYAAGPSKH